jgi:hypothetical protein
MSDVTVKAVIFARPVGLCSNCSIALNGSHSGSDDEFQSSPPPSHPPLIPFNQSNSFRPDQ